MTDCEGCAARVAELEAEIESLRALAFTDTLTGLPSRLALRQHLLAAIADSEPSLVIIDVNGLREVNNTGGHIEGDRLLRTVAGVIRDAVEGHEALAGRLGGDEFMVISTMPRADLLGVLEDLAVEAHHAALGVSIGVVEWESVPCHNSRCLLRAADVAMYRAKAMREHVAVTFAPANGPDHVCVDEAPWQRQSL